MGSLIMNRRAMMATAADEEDLGWENGVPYDFTWITGSYIETNGKVTNYNSWCRTPFLPCKKAGSILIDCGTASYANIKYSAFYDENMIFIRQVGTGQFTGSKSFSVPSNAAYFAISAVTNDKRVKFITPFK